jgi:hypothetical protein
MSGVIFAVYGAMAYLFCFATFLFVIAFVGNLGP